MHKMAVAGAERRAKMESLTSVVVAHADVVSDHVRHRAGQQVRLVHVLVDADADRARRAYRLRRGHARLASGERLAAAGGNTIDNGISASRCHTGPVPVERIEMTTQNRCKYWCMIIIIHCRLNIKYCDMYRAFEQTLLT